MSIAERNTRALQRYLVTDIGEKQYSIMFPFLNEARNISVYRRDSRGVLTKLVYPTEYTISINESGTNNIWGSVNINTGYDLYIGDTLTIERTIPTDQEITFSNQKVFSSTMDYAIDKLTAKIQDMQILNSTLHAPIDENVNEKTLNIGLVKERANKVLGFDTKGDVTYINSGGGSDERSLRIPLGEDPIPDLMMYKALRSGNAPYFDSSGNLQWLQAESLIGIDQKVMEAVDTAHAAEGIAGAASAAAAVATGIAEAAKTDSANAVEQANAARNDATEGIRIAREAEVLAGNAEEKANIAKNTAEEINKELPELRYRAGENIEIKHNWSLIETENTHSLWGITCGKDSQGKDLYVVVGRLGAIWISSDGMHWSSKGGDTIVDLFNEIEYANGKFIAVGRFPPDGGNRYGLIYLSDDGGETWRNIIPPENLLQQTSNLYEIKYVNNEFVAVGNESFMIRSKDGETWDRIDGIPSNKNLHGIAYHNGLYIVPTYENTILLGREDTPGVWTWESTSELVNTHFLFDAEYGNGMYVVVGTNQSALKGIILTSENPSVDSSSWKIMEIEGVTSVNSIVYRSGQFIAAGDNGVILTSSDGERWSKERTGSITKMWGVASNGRSIVSIDDEWKIYRSSAQTWHLLRESNPCCRRERAVS